MKRFEFNIHFGGKAFFYFDNQHFKSAMVVYSDHVAEVVRESITGEAYNDCKARVAKKRIKYQLRVLKDMLEVAEKQGGDREQYEKLLEILKRDTEVYHLIG